MDNWKHRSKAMICKTCMFFTRKLVVDEKEGNPLIHTALGRCRRHAPTLSGWPVMFPTDWCGDHKIDENKLCGQG